MLFRKSFLLFSLIAITILPFATVTHAAQDIVAIRVSSAPTLDGSDNDSAWSTAYTYTIKDKRTGSDITLQAVYSGDMFYFLVKYPDATRDDTFFFKWNMMDKKVDLSNFADNDYTADIWYWKAHRTNPSGYADDKSHVLSTEPGKKAKKLISRTGKTMYLMRLGDAGKPAQAKQILVDYQGDVVLQYTPAEPEGSRADVKAKGVWRKGAWIIEFARKFNTGYDDDVQLDPGSGKKYLFGVSIKSCYGEVFNDTLPNLYGQGRLSDPLYLVFR
ncbi:MAG: ethylbenzene dehydrogenase-related protein [bacterium]